jgi:parallel beta-helix repeat protein
MKFVGNGDEVFEGLVVRNNHVHHNYGKGIWLDGSHLNSLIEGNLSEHNTHAGIAHEISYKATIRNNTVRGGEGAAIIIINSTDVEVHHNTIEDNESGIYGIDDTRGSGPLGPWALKNLWVHDNTITLPSGVNGMWGQNDSTYTSKNNRFDHNTYNAHPDKPFWWKGRNVSWDEWQADGQDPNGSFN